MGPLKGLRILDMTTVLMGPYATQSLGDMGAEVIKVEPPEGDLVRRIGPARSPGMGPIFLNTNRSKRSLALDLKTAAGRGALLRLIEGADVLVSNVRPAAMARLGLEDAALAGANPRLIRAALVGYGQDGPYAAHPAYDDLIQGAACIPYLFLRAGHGAPAYVPAAIADRITGLAAVNAILAAVIERAGSGLGQRVEVPMFETLVSLVLGDHLGGLSYAPPLDGGGYARHLSPDRRPYATRDGHVCALVYTDGHWRRFLGAVERADLAADPRFASFEARMAAIDHVYAELAAILATRDTAHWLALFERIDVPAMPMHSFETVLADRHLVETGFFQVVEHPSEGRIRSMKVAARFSRSPAAPTRPAPRLGADRDAVLAAAGYDAAGIAALARQGAFGPLGPPQPAPASPTAGD